MTLTADPTIHRCGPREMDYMWQRVENEDLIRAIVDGYMLNPVVHRSSSCRACGRTWYVIDYEKKTAPPEGIDVVDDAPQARAMVCLPRPTDSRRREAPKWKGKGKRPNP